MPARGRGGCHRREYDASAGSRRVERIPERVCFDVVDLKIRVGVLAGAVVDYVLEVLTGKS